MMELAAELDVYPTVHGALPESASRIPPKTGGIAFKMMPKPEITIAGYSGAPLRPEATNTRSRVCLRHFLPLGKSLGIAGPVSIPFEDGIQGFRPNADAEKHAFGPEVSSFYFECIQIMGIAQELIHGEAISVSKLLQAFPSSCNSLS